MESCIYLVVHDETCDTTDRTLNHYAFRELSAARQCAKQCIESAFNDWRQNYTELLPYNAENEQKDTAVLYQFSEDDCTLDVWENGRESENSTHIHIEKLELL